MRICKTRMCLLLTLLPSVWAGHLPAQLLTQSVILKPGWNAVWLEVEPTNPQPASVFANLPLASAWTWSERVSATDFIQNPEVTGWNRARWLSYFPPDSSQAPLANLYAILPRRAYLVKVSGASNVTWNVTGLPSVVSDKWSPDRYNLRGFPVHPDQPPTFVDFFRNSAAHYDNTTGSLESIFHLDPAGTWTLVKPTDRMQRGEAYWVYTRGASDYVAPFSLETTTGDGLDFGDSLQQCNVLIHNVSDRPTVVRFDSVIGNPAGLVLYDPASPTNSTPFAGYTQMLAPHETAKLTVQLNRLTPGTTRGNVLAASDSSGTRFYVSQSGAVGLLAGGAGPLTGLWAGTATITNVSVVGTNAASGTNTCPVLLGFPLRVLVHVDTNGQPVLLREITLLYAHGGGLLTNINGIGFGQPLALITDPGVLASLSPSDLRSRLITARRMSAPHFDFLLPVGRFELPLTGLFAVSNQVTATLNVPESLPTNPFLHRYHPDHGTNQAYALTRQIAFNLAPGAGNGSVAPGDTLGGTFSEVIYGLHKLPLFASGQLELQRVSTKGVLNTLSSH
jgi:hypothetical protein